MVLSFSVVILVNQILINFSAPQSSSQQNNVNDPSPIEHLFLHHYFIYRYRDNNRQGCPRFVGDFAKSKEELLLKEAVNKGGQNQALMSYRLLIAERISDGNEIDIETAEM